MRGVRRPAWLCCPAVAAARRRGGFVLQCRERLEQYLRDNRVPFQVYFQAGTHTDTMSVRYADFERRVKPAVAEFGRPA